MDNFKDFIKQSNQSQSYLNNYFKQLDRVYLFSSEENLSDDEIQQIINITLYGYGKSQIYCFLTERYYLKKQQQYYANINVFIDSHIILNSILNRKFELPYKYITFNINNQQELYPLHKQLLEANIDVDFQINLDDDILEQFETQKFYDIHILLMEIHIFSRLIAPQQIANPKIIFFDLFEF
ncbi:hypothetical protein ABPG74_022313 [Tetrahymena malaccensis]